MNAVQADVVVVGSGLAGIVASIEAARAGARVALLAGAKLCGGSSFSPYTWGLGMVSPLDLDAERRRDPESLTHAVEAVGAYQSKPELVEALMEDASSAINFLISLGATVTEPIDANQREFVPCFDSRVRGWHGFHAGESRGALAHAVQSTEDIQVYEGVSALSLLQADGAGSPVSGVVGCQTSIATGPTHALELLRFEAPAVILATGGATDVYEHHLGGGCCLGAVMAHEAGADLVNLEFLQLMLGFELPSGRKVVCNEKLWRHSDVLDERGISVFDQMGASREVGRAALETHSWHGPFTTARESQLLELAVQSAASHGHQAYLHLSEEFLDGVRPEFVDTYLDWLRRRGVDPKAPVPIALYAHSCNGGITIDAHGATSVPGLYAAGECAGGVHGADRIGGLASVTALVFGRRAGREAAHCALGCAPIRNASRLSSPFCSVSDVERVTREVGKAMDEHCLVNRTDRGLREVIQRMNDLYDECCAHEKSLLDIACPQEALKSFRARGKLVAARLMAEAMLGRRSSLGSHHRADSMC